MLKNAFFALRGGRLLLRPRAHSQLPRCLNVPTSVRFAHSSKQPLDKSPFPTDPDTKVDESMLASFGLRLPQTIEEAERLEGPLTEEQINDPNATEISIYEQDPTSPTGERLVQHIRTPEERRKHNEIHKMLMRAESDPNYDDRELNRHLLDDLMKDPYFADLTDDLKEIKENFVLTKQQQEEMLEEAGRAEEKAEKSIEKELTAHFQMATHDTLEELKNDPLFAYARAELEELQDALPEPDGDTAEYDAAMEKVVEKLIQDPNLERKMTEWQADKGSLDPANPESLETDQFVMPDELKELAKEPEELTALLRQMKELMRSMGMGSLSDPELTTENALDTLEAEMEKVLNEDPDNEDLEEEEIKGREMNFAELGKELFQLAKSSPAGGARDFDEEDEPVDPELEAKVDKIMKDPKLMEKLMYIQQVIKEEQQKQQPMELAPDPLELEPHRITSIQKRMQVAKQDPEHLAAMESLRVHLAPPFNIAPALRIFNDAIEYAYIGANDDIRRILWRAYSKARVLPTFLQNLSDDAWDIMYYSQAVTWTSNQNRENHLRLLLQDLQSVGKDGPPTHPDVVAEMQQ
ncbi:hypothetical protein DPSP01_002257 [Paraphaeosphaeria sporulosa]|uniref:Uncharacterized protein n=1 Tax=Paraphaeosphaeria sporulosa TaxID=1460663 RepID=A0A177BZ13_9PLEO|nr:uncharacterized protein CC84DRAFT_1168688 [Paraphaeosphaeria sporulosa]OAG00613.1 hypothetical protein CC84DRAFT_1168688 [Paraphaeosphaeria sporulosa]